jgi:RNA polymerase sigma-70 factor (ECF subfamily)
MEAQLITQAQDGNRDAFAKLVDLYGRRIYYAAYSFLRNVDDAADIVQEVFLRAYKNIGSFDTSRAFYPWLYRIARNLCINTVQKASRKDTALPAEELLSARDGDPASDLLRKEEVEQLREAIERLSDKHREIIKLKTFQECSYAEIADILGIPIGTVMSRLYAARSKLRELLVEVNA